MVTWWVYDAMCLLHLYEMKTCQHAHLVTLHGWLFVRLGLQSTCVLQVNQASVAVVSSCFWALSPELIWLWSIPTITDTWQTAAHSSSALSGQSTCVCTAWGQIQVTHIHSNICFNPPYYWLLSLRLCGSGFQRNEILLLIKDGTRNAGKAENWNNALECMCLLV